MTRRVPQPFAYPPIANGCQKPGRDSTLNILDWQYEDFGDCAIEVHSATCLFIVAFPKQPSNRLQSSRRELGSRSSSMQAGHWPVRAVGISPVAAGVDALTAEVDFKVSSWICGRPAALIENHAQKEFRVSTEEVDLIACATRYDDLIRLMCRMQRPTSARRRRRISVEINRQYDPIVIGNSVLGLRCRQDSSLAFIDGDCLGDGQGRQSSRPPVLSENVVATKCLQPDLFPAMIGSVNHISSFTSRLELSLDRLKQSGLVSSQKALESLRQVLTTVLESSRCIVESAMLAYQSLCLRRLTATALLGGIL